ncbi:glycosyltransferase [Halobacteriales archaeon Cl-PHB]
MNDRPPTSVLLPTTRPVDAIDDLAAQLGPGDELLVVADHESDPVVEAGRDMGSPVDVVLAGDPEGCSGKANAIAAGMAAASHDRIVWTDDDFDHPPHWLATLQADYERHGPVSEVPVFVGRDPLATFLEPVYLLGGTLGTWSGNKAWGGAVVFERSDLDLEAFLTDLRRTVSDDALLSEYLDVTTLRRSRTVAVGGTVRETVERHVRFVQIIWQFDRAGALGSHLVVGLLAALSLLAPLPSLLAVSGVAAVAYRAVGQRRWTALLAYPALFLGSALFGYALARRTFVWGGRRYRWPSKFDVRVLD